MNHNAILTCALTGVLTNPKQHPVPVTPAQMAAEARDACPGVIINLTTGVIGRDISGPLACLRRVKPETAACNAGSLNYLKIKDNGDWAWPVHQKTAELGGNLRTSLEDTFYLPGGERASGNGALIEALAACAQGAGRGVAPPAEARTRLGLHAGTAP